MDNKHKKMDSPQAIGNRIYNQRTSLGMTQDELSEHLGCTPNYLGQLERGTRRLSLAMAEKLCYFFGLSYDYLFLGKESEEFNNNIAEELNFNANPAVLRMLSQCTPGEQELCSRILKDILVSLHSFAEKTE